MSVLSRIADRLILCPSTDRIDPGEKRRIVIPFVHGHLEAWIATHPAVSRTTFANLSIIKFPGTAGRAERAGVHPAELWPGVATDIWTINPPGYGGSSGSARIESFPGMAATVYEFVQDQNPELPILVVGNSLGCLSALFLAAHFDVCGVVLRNPPPIDRMIRTRPRYSWWNFGLSRWIADQVPAELDAVANARRSNAICLFIQSAHDRVVPTKYQDLIIDAYAGEKQVFRLAAADHHHSVSDAQQDDYVAAISWLGKRAGVL